jgi:membrane protease YdiL (CAAX protease family)
MAHTLDKFVPVPWTARDALFGLALVLAGTTITFTLLRWLGDQSGSPPGVPLVSLVLGLLPGLMVLAVWLLGINQYRAPWRTLGLTPPRERRYLFLPWLVLLLSLAFAGVYYTVVTALGIKLLLPEPVPSWVLGNGLYLVVNTVSLGIIGPLTEEMFFRGFLLAALLHPLGALRATLVASAIFSASHVNLGVMVPFFVTGMLLSWLYLRSRSIWPPFAAHAAQNLMAIALAPS